MRVFLNVWVTLESCTFRRKGTKFKTIRFLNTCDQLRVTHLAMEHVKCKNTYTHTKDRLTGTQKKKGNSLFPLNDLGFNSERGSFAFTSWDQLNFSLPTTCSLLVIFFYPIQTLNYQLSCSTFRVKSTSDF